MFKRAQEPLADWQNLKDEDRAKAQRLERRAWMFQNTAVAVLGASVVGTILTTRADWAVYFPFLMWVHVAIVLLAGGGFLALRKMPTPGPGRASPILRELFAPWVLVAALVAVVAAAPNWAGTGTGLEDLPDGTPVTSRNWSASPDGKQFSLSVNRGPAMPIPGL